MGNTRWINQSQPQSLVNATVLLYLNAAMTILFLQFASIPGLLTLAGIGAGWGIANEKRWGYILAAIVALVPLLFLLLAIASGLGSGAFASVIISLLFKLLLVGLIFHPASRSYQRIWFK